MASLLIEVSKDCAATCSGCWGKLPGRFKGAKVCLGGNTNGTNERDCGGRIVLSKGCGDSKDPPRIAGIAAIDGGDGLVVKGLTMMLPSSLSLSEGVFIESTSSGEGGEDGKAWIELVS